MVVSTLRNILFGDPRASRAAVLEQRAALAGGRIVPWQAGRPTWPSRTIDTYDAGAYRRIALIFRSVQYLADAAGSAPLRVYQRTEGEAEAVEDHPLRQLLARPNAGMGEARFLSFVMMTLAVAGFCVVEKERDGLGNVIGLWPLRSDWLRPIPRQQAMPDWEYRVPGYQDPFRLEAEDVIPISYADTPDHSPTGIGPLEVLLREIGITATMTDFLKTFMDRGAMPLYVMVPSDDPSVARQWQDQSTKDAFMTAWRARYGGLPNAVEPMPLVGIKDIKPLGFNFDELAYPELNNLTDARIATGFGIPPILLGAQVGLEQATYSNYGQARTSFYEDTMGPLWGRLDDAFTRHLLPEFAPDTSLDVQFDLSHIPALQDDEDAKWARSTAALTAGGITVNDFRRIVGLPQLATGGDVLYIPFSTTATPVTLEGQRRRATVEMIDTSHRALPEPRIVTRDGRRYLNERALTPEQRATNERIATHHRDAILRHADRAEPIVTAYLAGQRDRVVQAVTGERSVFAPYDTPGEVRAIETIDWDAESDLLLDELRQWLNGIGADAFAVSSDLLGTDDVWRVSNAYLRELEDLLGHRIVGITATTRADVETIIRDALTEGTSIPDLAEKLEGLFDTTYSGRAMTVARSESQYAFNVASGKAYEASGVVDGAILHDNPQHTESYGASDGLTCAQRNKLIVTLRDIPKHANAEHPNGTMAASPWVRPLED